MPRISDFSNACADPTKHELHIQVLQTSEWDLGAQKNILWPDDLVPFSLLLSFLCYQHLLMFHFTVRLNKEPPNITFRKKEKGGINLQTTVCMNITQTGIMLQQLLNLQFQQILDNFVA